eukprot:TRINITY_DN44528_c0_g1_i1.p2 TRINITY_DN44528_c0_g1~~TRINITY_DN44528_c0_g1_i1.p2  ORF type:complete len:324 (-),score=30.75 TRINITY_DN44528_c0_g1_i1:274-1152(-)
MQNFIYASLLLSLTLAQTEVKLHAQGLLPDGSNAQAVGQGVGSNVQGDAIVEVNSDLSTSSVILTATGPSTTTPTSKPTPQAPKVVTYSAKKPSTYLYVKEDHRCEDVKDELCIDIGKYKNCGYCIIDKYPTKGYGCSYTKEIIKKADKTMGHEYVTKIVPQCDCEGVYILEDKYCPSCDTILEELKKCSGTQKTTGVIEIQEKCLAIVGVTEKVLSKCGFIETKPTKLTKKQYVQVVDPTIKKDEQVVVVVQPQIPVDTPKATATAIATASAVGGSAVANAVVSASGGKNL